MKAKIVFVLLGLVFVVAMSADLAFKVGVVVALAGAAMMLVLLVVAVSSIDER